MLLYWVRCFFCLVTKLCLTLLRTHGLCPARLLYPWDFPDKNTGVGCHFLLLGFFLTQRLKPHLWHYRQNLYHWAIREAYVGCIHIYNCYVFLFDLFLYHSVVSLFISGYCLYFKVYFIWNKHHYPNFSSFLFHRISFPDLHFQSLCIFRSQVNLLEAACVWFLCFTHSAILCLLTGAFNPSFLKAIIDRYVLLLFCWFILLLLFTFFLFFSLLLWFDDSL